MSGPSLRRNFAWVFVGSVALALSVFAIQVVIAKLAPTQVQGAERVGDWTLANTITGPVFVFFFLKLRAVQATDTRGEHTWAAYAAVRSLAMVAALLVSAAVVLARYRDAAGWVIVAVAAMKVFEGGSDLIYGHVQRNDHMDLIARSQLGRGVTSLVAAVAVLWFTDSVALTAATVAAAYAVWMVADVVATHRRFGLTWPTTDRPAIARLVRQCAPLGLVTAIGSLQTNIPRYFLEHDVSRAALGVFGIMQTLLVFGGLIINAIAHAALPRLARHAAEHQWVAFARTLRKLIALGAGLGGLAVLTALVVGKPVLRIMFSSEFAQHSGVLVWIAATSGLLWMYLFLGTALDAMRRYRVQPWIHGASTTIIAVAAWLLVPRHGLYGATWAMLIGYAVECLMYVVVVAVPLRAELRRHATPPAS